jgi:hypothetical protein
VVPVVCHLLLEHNCVPTPSSHITEGTAPALPGGGVHPLSGGKRQHQVTRWLLGVPALNAPCDSPVQLAAAAAAHPTLLFRTGTQHDTPPDLPVSDRHWNHTIT